MSSQVSIIADNAVRDMLDEWVLTLCIVLSIAAIACPLLILFGLKQGVVQSVRDEFIKDPTYREIRPRESIEYAADFFTELDADPRVELVVPNITRSASSLQLQTADGTRSRNTDTHPTVAGDPLLLLNDAVVPRSGEVVVSAPLAEEFELAVGDEITLFVSRRYEGKSQSAPEPARVVGVLDPRADGKNGLYVPLPLAVDVESFRFGRHVDREGWPPGTVPKTREVIDELVVGCEAELSPDVVSRATIRTEFKGHRLLSSEEAAALWPGMAANELVWHAFRASGGPTSERNVKGLRSELRGLGCKHFLRRVDERTATDADGTALTLKGLSLEERNETLFSAGFERAPDRPFSESLRAIASASGGYSAGGTATLEVPVGQATFTLPVRIESVSEAVPMGELLVPLELLARLRTGDDTPVAYDERSGEVIIGELGYSGFRAYARTIDDVPALAGDISRLGDVEIIARTDEIVRARILDQGLTKIVWIIAIVGLVGGAGALIASLVASVERKKAEMGTYRLLGFGSTSVALFPVVQGVLIALAAVLIAGTLYVVFGQIVDEVLGTGGAGLGEEGIVRVRPLQFAAFAAGLALLAALCASVAARRSIRIEPAEALRAE